MTSGPHVNTAQPPGPAAIPSDGQPGIPTTSISTTRFTPPRNSCAAARRDRRKIIFLISDGQNAKNNTHSYNDTLKLLLSEDISVYAVGVGEANLNRGITFLGNNILAKYAHATGGDIFYGGGAARNWKASTRGFRAGAQPVHHRAIPARKTDRSRPYHTIEVRVKRPGLTLLARDGYYLSDKP